MKIVIWIVTWLVLYMLNTLLGEVTGFRLGILLIILLWGLITNPLIRAWNRHKLEKQANAVGMEPGDLVMKRTPSHVLGMCEEYRCQEKMLRKYLKNEVSIKEVHECDMDYLMQEFMVPSYKSPEKNDSAEPAVSAQKPTTSQKTPCCSYCGAELIEGARFCRECGREIKAE